MRASTLNGIVTVFALLFFSLSVYAEEQEKQGMPPAIVVVTEVTSGTMAPESEFVGTVYYQEVSDIASEVDGIVEDVTIEDGQRVKKGQVLARLNSDILRKTLQATEASYEKILSDLEKAKRDLQRSEKLFKEELTSEQSYDEQKFKVSSLENQAISLDADVQRFRLEIGKKTILSPYQGIIMKKHVDRGEWIARGATVAKIGKDNFIDVIADVSEPVLRFIKQGTEVSSVISGREFAGKIIAIIPSGDISTRTFPVKVRIRNDAQLIEGMEARISLPTGNKVKTLNVSRDAVIAVFGMNVVYTIADSKAKMIPVQVVGYKGMIAGIHAQGLETGMKVVIKGNERLRDGQAVTIQE